MIDLSRSRDSEVRRWALHHLGCRCSSVWCPHVHWWTSQSESKPETLLKPPDWWKLKSWSCDLNRKWSRTLDTNRTPDCLSEIVLSSGFMSHRVRLKMSHQPLWLWTVVNKVSFISVMMEGGGGGENCWVWFKVSDWFYFVVSTSVFDQSAIDYLFKQWIMNQVWKSADLFITECLTAAERWTFAGRVVCVLLFVFLSCNLISLLHRSECK